MVEGIPYNYRELVLNIQECFKNFQLLVFKDWIGVKMLFRGLRELVQVELWWQNSKKTLILVAYWNSYHERPMTCLGSDSGSQKTN